LWKLLSTSSNVSALPSEGQFIPELEAMMREKPWRREHVLPWPTIKSVWHSYWDSSKPILLEKSPPHIIRAADIAEYFQPSRFIVMARNPYAQAEGLMRRNRWPADRAANFALMCLRTQQQNVKAFPESIVLSYESLVADPAQACARIGREIPLLADMNPDASFELDSVDGTLTRPIVDLNQKKIQALSDESFTIVSQLFSQHKEVLDAWGYELLQR